MRNLLLGRLLSIINEVLNVTDVDNMIDYVPLNTLQYIGVNDLINQIANPRHNMQIFFTRTPLLTTTEKALSSV